MRRAGEAVVLSKGGETVNVERDGAAHAYWKEQGYSESTGSEPDPSPTSEESAPIEEEGSVSSYRKGRGSRKG